MILRVIKSTSVVMLLIQNERGDPVACVPVDSLPDFAETEFFPPFEKHAPSRLATLIALREWIGRDRSLNSGG